MTFDAEKLDLKNEIEDLKEQVKCLTKDKERLCKLRELDSKQSDVFFKAIKFYRELSVDLLSIVNKTSEHLKLHQCPDLSPDILESMNKVINLVVEYAECDLSDEIEILNQEGFLHRKF